MWTGESQPEWQPERQRDAQRDTLIIIQNQIYAQGESQRETQRETLLLRASFDKAGREQTKEKIFHVLRERVARAMPSATRSAMHFSWMEATMKQAAAQWIWTQWDIIAMRALHKTKLDEFGILNLNGTDDVCELEANMNFLSA